MRLERYTEKAQQAFQDAQELMQEMHHTQLDVEHIFLALLRQPKGLTQRALEKLGVMPEEVQRLVERELERVPKAYGNQYGYATSQVYLTPRAQRLMKRAEQEADRLQDQYVGTEHLLIALASEREGASARIISGLGVSQERIYQVLMEIRGSQRADDPGAETRYEILEKYSVDMTALARDGNLDPLIGREAELLRLMRILSRRGKNNPVLVGETGVGNASSPVTCRRPCVTSASWRST
jgi:ATP-dependent Clp protease ATP-binding subunit ClpC